MWAWLVIGLVGLMVLALARLVHGRRRRVARRLLLRALAEEMKRPWILN